MAPRELHERARRVRSRPAAVNDEEFPRKMFAKMFHVKHFRVSFAVKCAAAISPELLADARVEMAYCPLAAERWQSPV